MGNTRDIYMRVKHAKDTNKEFLINEVIANKYKTITDNYTVKSGTIEAMEFVTAYLNFYSNIEELPEPEHPLAIDKTLENIFENEMSLFSRFIVKDSREINYITSLVIAILDISDELYTKILHNKMATILAYYTINSCLAMS